MTTIVVLDAQKAENRHANNYFPLGTIPYYYILFELYALALQIPHGRTRVECQLKEIPKTMNFSTVVAKLIESKLVFWSKNTLRLKKLFHVILRSLAFFQEWKEMGRQI